METVNYQDYIDTFTNQQPAVSLATPSWDLFTLLFYIAAVLLFIFALNRDRLLITVLSTYITIAIINTASFLELLYKDGMPLYFVKIIIFLILLVVINILISRAIGLSNIGFGNVRHVVILSILEAGFLISIILSFLPSEITSYLTFLTRSIFIGNLGRTVWFVLPIASLIFIKKKG